MLQIPQQQQQQKQQQSTSNGPQQQQQLNIKHLQGTQQRKEKEVKDTFVPIHEQIANLFFDLTYTYEARDKVTKGLQYLAKFLSWYYQHTDPEKGIKYFQISERFRDARSLFRILKFSFEVKRIEIIMQTLGEDVFSLVTNISSRAFYFFYWFFDNIYILQKYLDIHSERFPKERFKSLSRTFWLLGLIMFLIYCVKTLRKTYTDESDLKVAALNKMTVNQMKQNLQIICKLRRDYQLNFARAMSDLIICLNENNLPFLILGKRINQGVEGIFGMFSALIYLYDVAKSRKYR